ncbi:MAG: PEP-CTERM sorting domain-containing protein [Akkermansiaceae bacterium]|nr:PEP-CTERM sorting domain-containing protein [Akkermansiaceae bacterium]
MNNKLLIPLLSLAFSFSVNAATYVISASSTTRWKDSGGSDLTRGDAGIDGDGAVIQIGYFMGVSSTKNPLTYNSSDWAAFTPITGLGSLNSGAFDTTIGDNVANPGTNAPDGMYSLGITYDDQAHNGLATPIPPAVRLGIRVYESTSDTTGKYNTVTRANDAWVLSKVHDDFAPGDDPQLVINGLTPTNELSWEDSANSFKTTIVPVPEPSSFALLGLGALALTFRRRK